MSKMLVYVIHRRWHFSDSFDNVVKYRKASGVKVSCCYMSWVSNTIWRSRQLVLIEVWSLYSKFYSVSNKCSLTLSSPYSPHYTFQQYFATIHTLSLSCFSPLPCWSLFVESCRK